MGLERQERLGRKPNPFLSGVIRLFKSVIVEKLTPKVRALPIRQTSYFAETGAEKSPASPGARRYDIWRMARPPAAG
jgi:hypothetical protein